MSFVGKSSGQILETLEPTELDSKGFKIHDVDFDSKSGKIKRIYLASSDLFCVNDSQTHKLRVEVQFCLIPSRQEVECNIIRFATDDEVDPNNPMFSFVTRQVKLVRSSRNPATFDAFRPRLQMANKCLCSSDSTDDNVCYARIHYPSWESSFAAPVESGGLDLGGGVQSELLDLLEFFGDVNSKGV